MVRNSHPMDSSERMGSTGPDASLALTNTIQITISDSRSSPSGNNCGKIARSSLKDGRFQKPEENLWEKDRISGDSNAAGRTTPTTPAISLREGRRPRSQI